MKKFGLFMVLTLFSVVSFTSCLGDNGNTENITDLGVLGYGSGNLVLRGLGPTIYSPEITAWFNAGNMEIGGCYLYDYRIDYDLPENSESMFLTNGYYTVSINSIYAYGQYSMSYELTDTSTVQMGEIAVQDGLFSGDYSIYSRGHLFTTQIASLPNDIKSVNWDISYDSETMMPTEADGERFYDLFLRASTYDESESKTVESYYFRNAYNIQYYIINAANKEKDYLAGFYTETSSIKLRLNYAESIKDGVITWNSKVIPLGIAYVLSLEN